MGEWVKVHSTSSGEREVPDSSGTELHFSPKDQGTVTFSASAERNDITIFGQSLEDLGIKIDQISFSIQKSQQVNVIGPNLRAKNSDGEIYQYLLAGKNAGSKARFLNVQEGTE